MFIVPYYYVLDINEPGRHMAVMDESNTRSEAEIYCEKVKKEGYSGCFVSEDFDKEGYRCICDLKEKTVKVNIGDAK